MPGGFYCPKCKILNSCNCEVCKPQGKEPFISWEDNGEIMICGNCNTHFPPDAALDEENKTRNMNIDFKELEKLYPELKVPYEKETEYYLKTLEDSGVDIKTIIDNVKDFNATMLSAEYASLTKYKYKKLDELVAFIKEKYSLQGLQSVQHNYDEKEFNDYKPNKHYYSIDLRQANFASLKDTFLNEIKSTNWEDWLKEEGIELHPIVSNSKSFRQIVFGNTNPKFLQSVQKRMMANLIGHLRENFLSSFMESLVGKKSDELIFELDELLLDSEYEVLKNLVGSKFKITLFTITDHKNYGDGVRIKHFNSKPDKLMGVSGNRFYLHLKTLILKQELDERDLYFVQDKNLAKWVL